MNYDSLVASMWRLVKRRWYVFVVALVFGGVLAHLTSTSTSYNVEQNVRIGSLADASFLLDAGEGEGEVPDVDVLRLAQQAQLDFEQSELDDTVAATYTANSTARTITLRVSGPTEQAADEALIELDGRFTSVANGALLAQIGAGIDNAEATIESLDANADALIEQIGDSDIDQTTLAVLVGELSSVRGETAEARNRQRGLQSLNDYVENSLVIFGSSSADEGSRGLTGYAAGVLGAGALGLLAAAGWVLSDRRVRRLVHLERAAPGTPVLGFVDASSADAVDESIKAAARCFVHDHQLDRLVVFGLRGARTVEALGRAIEIAVDVPVEVSTASSAGVVAAEAGGSVGYVGIARWGSTTEDQVSTAVGDVARAGDAPISIILADIPGRERDWVGAGISTTL